MCSKQTLKIERLIRKEKSICCCYCGNCGVFIRNVMRYDVSVREIYVMIIAVITFI